MTRQDKLDVIVVSSGIVGFGLGILIGWSTSPQIDAKAEPVECYSEQAVIEFVRLAVAAERDGPSSYQMRFEQKVEARGE